MNTWKLDSDLASIQVAQQIDWKQLHNARLLLTGGTGFIGRWLLEALQQANDRLALNLHITVPSRQPNIFRQRAGHLLVNGKLDLLPLDIAVSRLNGDFTHIIHAATDASAALNDEAPLTVFRTIVRGTEHVLELAASQPGTKVLFLSSGAVYGQQPQELAGIPESWNGSPNPQLAKNAYGEAKRAAEMLCAVYRKQFAVNVVTARIFSLLGPFMPLDTHFAAGNFIRDALAEQRIIVQGNGRPIRSYLYPSDLVIWLLTLLTASPRQAAYNVGSERGVSIAELAQTVAQLISRQGHEVLGRDDTGWNAGRYVPDTSLIRKEFDLTESVTLEYSILSTAAASLLTYNLDNKT
jgi:nucleoside-diphosphate-sugar epimerase